MSRIESLNALRSVGSRPREGRWDGFGGGEPVAVSSPVTDGFVSCLEYAQAEADLSRSAGDASIARARELERTAYW